jgi:hypothetical protein
MSVKRKVTVPVGRFFKSGLLMHQWGSKPIRRHVRR